MIFLLNYFILLLFCLACVCFISLSLFFPSNFLLRNGSQEKVEFLLEELETKETKESSLLAAMESLEKKNKFLQTNNDDLKKELKELELVCLFLFHF